MSRFVPGEELGARCSTWRERMKPVCCANLPQAKCRGTVEDEDKDLIVEKNSPMYLFKSILSV